ncbi:MAG TPA: hypothetical protein VK489_08115 [Ferruginibacter sp.]|nr:hypothetical protein [Ferruginibacter sp.]
MTGKLLLSINITALFLLTSSPGLYAQENVSNSITFIQGDSSYTIFKSSDSVILERTAFALRYFGKQYDDKKGIFNAAQVAVLDNPADTVSLKTGQYTKHIPYFEPGTGMAPGENERYDTIIISNTGHHYLTYENEKEKRVNLISRNQDILQLEWKISAAFYEEKDIPFSDLKLTALYLVIFIDNNLNDIIDNAELKIIKLVFK